MMDDGWVKQAIEDAVKDAVKEHGQDEELALRLIAWFNAVTKGNEQITGSDAATRRLEVLFECTVVEDTDAILSMQNSGSREDATET